MIYRQYLFRKGIRSTSPASPIGRTTSRRRSLRHSSIRRTPTSPFTSRDSSAIVLGEALAREAEENPQIVALLRNEAVKTSPIANYVLFLLAAHAYYGRHTGRREGAAWGIFGRSESAHPCHRGLERYGAPMLRPAAEARRTGGRAGLLFGNFRTRKLIRIMIVKSTDTVRDIIIGRGGIVQPRKP